MASGVGELFIQFGVEGDASKLDKFTKKVQELAQEIDVNIKKQDKTNNNLGQMFKRFRRVALAVSGAIYAIDRLSNSLIKNNQVWLEFQNQTDLSISKLQGYAGVAGLLDKSLGMQGAAGSIAQLNEKLFELKLTGEGAKGFQIAGINPVGQDAFGVLEQVRERIKSLDNTQATYVLKQIGLDPKLLPMLRMEKSEFEELRKIEQRLQLTEEERAQILQYQIRLGIAHNQMSLAMQRLTLALMPLWTKLVEIAGGLAEGISNILAGFNKLHGALKAIILGFTAWGVSVGKLDILFKGKFIKNILRMVKVFTGLNLSTKMAATKFLPMLGNAIKGLAVTVGRALLPLISLFLILEDIAVWLMGGESVIGDYLNLWKSYKEGKENLNTPTLQDLDPNEGSGSTNKKLNLLETMQDAQMWETGKWGRPMSGDGMPSSYFASPEYYAKTGFPMTSSNTNNTTNNSSNVVQNNYITTNRPLEDMNGKLRYAQHASGNVEP